MLPNNMAGKCPGMEHKALDANFAIKSTKSFFILFRLPSNIFDLFDLRSFQCFLDHRLALSGSFVWQGCELLNVGMRRLKVWMSGFVTTCQASFRSISQCRLRSASFTRA